jgi:hypothetical protein
LQDLDRAVALRPSDPRFYATRGHLLQELKEYAAALTSYELSLAIRPDGGVLRARADALRNLLRFEEAADAYQRALAFAPNDPESAKAHVNWATCLLLLGKFAPGWEHMEWRWGDPAIHPPHPYPLDRLWIGEHDPAGRTLLVHSEQGYGDTLQFCRYASLLAARSVRVVLLVPPALETLLHSLGGVSSLVTATNAQTAYDLHTPLLSLPLALGTRLEDVPAKVPYLHASDARRRIWGHTLGPATKPRIGLVWAGNPAHGNDANRSMPLANLEALVAEFGSRFEWISLQREVHIADQGAIVRLGLHDFGARLRDFADTAALMAHLDLVISVDTAAAHLAGALARPVWIMLPFVPDWRWMLERTGSPWYPTARLFRQRRPGDWDAVVSELASGLREFLESTRRVLY